ncbi:hypothetical protein Micbo1qcDRAFT_225274 [Microdochium bolleyi]|uniref:Uncharacterized protein n=1 Tax=Microdochium bolleyi TaxID=196109 RepID=A0A136J2C8_9PEZI|nr:hypothetical protein Micbo1qcDRAFT_225274 [Microdochium bolleyi]
MAGFQFVVFGDEQPDTRRAIRSHVMRGKNAGRKLPPRQPSRKKNKRGGGGAAAVLDIEGGGTISDEPVRNGADDHGATNDRALAQSDDATPVLLVNEQRRAQLSVASLSELKGLPRMVGHELSWRPFPAGFTAESIDLFRFSCTSDIPPFCRPKDRRGSFFWQFSFLDEAFMHSMIAIIGALREESLPPTRHAPRLILSHVSRGLHLVNKQLQSASDSGGGIVEGGQGAGDNSTGQQQHRQQSSVSNATIASILLLSMYERLRGDYGRARVHLHGLKRIIVDLRGGMAQLRRTRGLASKICRIDIDLALHSGAGTVFSAAEAAPAMYLQQQEEGAAGGKVPPFMTGVPPEPVTAPHKRGECEDAIDDGYGATAQLSPRYGELMRDLLRLTAFLNGTAGRPVLDVYALEALLVNMCYRIVELRPLGQSNARAAATSSHGGSPRRGRSTSSESDFGQSPSGRSHDSFSSGTSPTPASPTKAPGVSSIDDACHLGMAALMTTLMLEFGAQLVTHDLLRSSLRASAARLARSGVQNLRAALWLCFVGGISVFKVRQSKPGISGRKQNGNTSGGGHDSCGADDSSLTGSTARDSRSENGDGDDGTWLLPQIHELAQDLGLDASRSSSSSPSWPAVLSVLSDFPWVHSLHDKPGQALWDAAVAMAAKNHADFNSCQAPPWVGSTGGGEGAEGNAAKLRPLRTLTHEAGLTLSHARHGVWR